MSHAKGRFSRDRPFVLAMATGPCREHTQPATFAGLENGLPAKGSNSGNRSSDRIERISSRLYNPPTLEKLGRLCLSSRETLSVLFLAAMVVG